MEELTTVNSFPSPVGWNQRGQNYIFIKQGSHSYASVKFHDFSMTFPWLFHDFSMTFNAFFHDYFTRLKCEIYEKCCNNHHTRPGHTFAIVTISKYVLDLQRVLSVSFIVKTFVNNVVRSVFHKKVLQNKFVQIWVFHDFFHDLLNSMTFPWPIIFHDFSMTSHFPWLFHDRRNPDKMLLELSVSCTFKCGLTKPNLYIIQKTMNYSIFHCCSIFISKFQLFFLALCSVLTSYSSNY